MKKVLWLLISCLMALSLLIASCGTSNNDGGTTTTDDDDDQVKITETEVPTGAYEDDETSSVVEKTTGTPEYGGGITLAWNVSEPDFDLLGWFATAPQHLAHQSIWDGDWAKGPAGGYGENIVTWEESTNVPELNTGFIAESWSWTVNEVDNTVSTTIILRDNIYFANPDTEAGRLVNGRKLTTEDVAWCLQQHISNEESDNYKSFPMCRDLVAEVTGPNEITIVHPFELHLDSIMRLFSYVLMFPPELWDEYGYNSCIDITKSVGTGPYYVTDYVPSNMVLLERNENYWKTDPVGPGEGMQLPYADSVKYIIMPDQSTREAALRTGKIDMLSLMEWEDADYMQNQNPDIMRAKRGSGQVPSAFFRMDIEPFNDLNVRKAMLYSVNLNEINESLYNGNADLISYPYYYTPAYAGLYLGLDDPAMPAEVADMYTYNPEKAKQLLADAGYPDGFKTDIVMSNMWPGCVDYYSVVKEYWAQAGIDVDLTLVPDNGQLIGTNASLGFDGMIAQFISPVSTYPEQAQYTGDSWLNPSRVNDDYVNQMAADARAMGVTSLLDAMSITKELTAYMLGQVYAVPAPRYPYYVMWWPWLKNYSGEASVGYMTYDTWTQYVWVDQDLKEAMGY